MSSDNNTPIGFEHFQNKIPGSQGIPMDSNEKTNLVTGSTMYTNGNDVKVEIPTTADMNDIPDRNTLLFRDGRRRIDYVLAYTDLQDATKSEQQKAYIKALITEGLEIEVEDKKFSQDGQTYFCKIYMPWSMCIKAAEYMKMKMPIQAVDIAASLSAQVFKPRWIFKPNIEEDADFFTAPFYKDGHFIGYKGPDKEDLNFFSPAQRNRMLYEVLLRIRYGDEREEFGIRRLIKDGVFTAAYPLHDGPYKTLEGPVDKRNKREELYFEWARPLAFTKEQPYDAIRNYFGEKVGIYFSWLGFYTLMLVPASMVGIAVFLYGLITLRGDNPSNEICNSKNITMCPLCDQRCGYWKLNESCTYSRVTYVVDNPATIFYAIFMALWCTFFIEFWKRQQVRLQYNWDVADYEEAEQTMRPEFEATVRGKKKNPVTQAEEPHLRKWQRLIRIGSSLVLILFMICVVLAAILAVIIYRIVIVVLIYNESDSEIVRGRARLITTITAAIISVVIISLLNKVYERIAILLTNMETWKYQSDWEDAFTFKMYVFQFVNYYGTIIYIAFFKGRLTGYPGHYDRTFSNNRSEECDPAGCFVELTIQLAIVMVGKQALNNFKEIIVPIIVRCIKERRGKAKVETDDDKYTSWERDYDLVDFPIFGLYEEYLEMVIQFGFVTLFVAAFPLAPFFALLNNVIEIRLDAMKLITQWKRPMAERGQDLGTWFFILKALSKLAVLVNACIIAFTSDFIQRTVYNFNYKEYKNVSYVEWSLSKFRTSDFDNFSKPTDAQESAAYGNLNTTAHYCRYRDFRSGPEDDYGLNMTYWHILTAKLAFVLLFEHVIFGLTALINFMIPDTPLDVKDRSMREKHLAKQALNERINAESGRRRAAQYAGSTASVQHATSL